ncbi:MAG TPA: GNAT family N-acetyltransferase [Nitrososphaerales archaeon]|nr:GNAT family N-acetyltransferase [Nitrososphaerales archaeon]
MTVQVQNLGPEDLEEASEIVYKFWSLNSEFEPTIELKDKMPSDMKADISRRMGRDDQIILVAKSETGVIGLIRIEIKTDSFYGSKKWGNIVEFYVMPRSRHKEVGKALLDKALQRLKDADIKSVTAEFPTQNTPAFGFYEKNGFRPFLSVYAADLS